MSRQRHIEKCHEYAMDRINDVLIELQDETVKPLVEEIAALRKRLWDAFAEGFHVAHDFPDLAIKRAWDDSESKTHAEMEP